MNLANEKTLHSGTNDRVPDARARILIIDDEPLNVALLEDMLSEGGYKRVKSITDSRVALETCHNFNPDLILLDWLMPHLNGLAVLEGLRAGNGEIFLPVIVLTADVNEETKLRALRAMATDYLHKPFDNEEVLLRIANLLEIRRLFIKREKRERELQRDKEIAEEENAAKDHFLAIVGDELHTPFNPASLGTLEKKQGHRRS